MTMTFLFKIFLAPDMSTFFFTFAIFIIYLRHHHNGQQITIEEVSKNIIATRAITGKKPFYWLDIPTYFLAVLFLSEKVNFYLSALIFVVWFVFTDIFRVRKTIYGTYISRWFYTSKICIKNLKWEMHKTDKDPFPSVPHMHATSVPLKLNIYTGEIYDSTNHKLVSIAKKKELKKLWLDEKFKSAVQDARETYRADNPNYVFSAIPTFN